MERDERGRFLPGNKEGRKITADGGLAAELGKQGGYARAEAAREQRSYAQWAERIMSTPAKVPMPDGTTEDGTWKGVMIMNMAKTSTDPKVKDRDRLAAQKLMLELSGEIEENVNLRNTGRPLLQVAKFSEAEDE
jgi:hypothetical protein